MTIHVVGLDLSLTRTGVAVWREGWEQPSVVSFKSEPQTENPTLVQRMGRAQALAVDIIRAATLGIQPGDLCLFVIEAPFYSPGLPQKGGHQHDRSILWGLVVNAVMRHGLPAEVAPLTLKKFVTGFGGGGKDPMKLAIGKQFPNVDARNDDERDAVGLVWMGARHLSIDPMIRNPRPDVSALDAVRWPLRERKI